MADLTTSIRIQILDAFSAPLRAMRGGLASVSQQLGAFEKHTKMAADLNQAAEGMGRFSSAIISGLEKPIKQFASFDQALAKVSAKTGEARGSEAFERLKTQAEELGAATKYSAEEVAGAQADYAASGRTTLEILQALPSSLSFATAGELSLARATEITNATLAQFNLTTADTMMAQDVLSKAADISSSSVDGLGESLAYVGTTASQMKVSLRDTTAMLAVLADNKITGSMGGTSLQQMFSGIVAPSKMAIKAFAEMGIGQQKLLNIQKMATTGKMPEALKQIAELQSKLSPEKSARLMDKIFGAQGGRAALPIFKAILSMEAKGFKDYQDKLKDVDGSTNKTAKIMETSLAGSLERAGGALSGLSTQIGEILAPSAESASKSVESASDTLRKLAKEYPAGAKASLDLVIGLGAVTLGLKTMLLTQSAYHGALAALGKTFAGLSTSLIGQGGLVVAAGLAGVAIGTWANETFGLADKISAAAGRAGPGQKGKAGTTEFADGTVLNAQTGTIMSMPANGSSRSKMVQRAIEATGTFDVSVLNRWIVQYQKDRARDDLQDVASGNAIRDDDGGFNAVTGKVQRGSPKVAVPRVGPLSNKIDVTNLAAATEAQTDELIAVMGAGNRIAEQQLEEQRKANRRSPYQGFGAPSNGGL